MHPDPSDRASEYEAYETAERIRLASMNVGVKRKPVDPGYCDECGDPTSLPGQLFCCVGCQHKDEQREKMQAMKGRRQ